MSAFVKGLHSIFLSEYGKFVCGLKDCRLSHYRQDDFSSYTKRYSFLVFVF